MYIGWLVALITLTANILWTIILSASLGPAIDILFTFLNFIVFGSLATYSFYLGYYGIAKRETRKLFCYKIFKGILVLFYIFMSISPFGAFHGWVRIPRYDEEDEGIADFGIFICVLESLIFTVLAALGVYCIYAVQTEKYMEKSQNFAN